MKRVQRGSAMLITLIIVAAMLGGAAVLAGMQIASSRGSDLTKVGTQATYCAEAGLAMARPVVIANYTSWGTAIAASGAAINLGQTPDVTWEPTWLTSGIGIGPGTGHDIDGDSQPDFFVYIKDNDDELTTANDITKDNDLKIFIVSRCTKYPEQMREVEELVQYTGGGQCYQSQQGGCGGNGNSNF